MNGKLLIDKILMIDITYSIQPAHNLIKCNQKPVNLRVQRQRMAAFNELQSYMNVSTKLSRAGQHLYQPYQYLYVFYPIIIG